MEDPSPSLPDMIRPASPNPEIALQFSAPFNPALETDFDRFPAAPAVFALFPGDESVSARPYLSQARDLQRRLRRLLGPLSPRRLNLRDVTRRIEYQRVGSAFEAQWMLYQLNRCYYPDQFRRRLRLKPPSLVKVKLRNRFPRCYPARRMSADGSLYYGPFPTRTSAERFTSEFLDLFKMRRCVPDLDPDPSHPGCIYSQMKMCLAPCFQGCTDEEYQEETRRVIVFLDSGGETLESDLEAERSCASENLEFELAARAHRKLEKAREVMRMRPALIKPISRLHAVMLLPSAEAKAVVFFRVVAGEIRGPVSLSLAENVSSPVPLDQRLQALLESLASPAALPAEFSAAQATPASVDKAGNPPLPPWEHLSLLARWYYSSFRSGEFMLIPDSQAIPHSRLIKLCRKIVDGNH
ncbi:MAG TPA: hypothetical protein VGY31_13645 [Terriglobia bacterium]|nr:hypothetical protein [Terriglobia bacterium]